MRVNIALSFSLAFVLGFLSSGVMAQEAHHIQLNAMPQTINPAFTGMFNGSVRATGIYRSQWNDVGQDFTTFGASIDLPLYINKQGNYVGAGVQFVQDRFGDNVLANALISVAYHKAFGMTEFRKIHRGGELGIGVQAALGKQAIDASALFYANESLTYFFIPGTGVPYSNTGANYTSINAGACYSQALGNKVNYTIGLAGINLNQQKKEPDYYGYYTSGLQRTLTGTLAVNWQVSKRLVIRPTFYAKTKEAATDFIGGSEVQFQLRKDKSEIKRSASIFAGAFYRSGDAATMTGGVEFRAFRVGLAYDAEHRGNGGLELAVRFTGPDRLIYSRFRSVPSSHF